MSQDKYLAASRGLRASTLLLATTVATVLQSLPQALGIDQYRNLRKAVDGLQKADAEMTELEDEISVKLAEIEKDQLFNTSADQIREREGMEPPIATPTPADVGEPVKKPVGRGNQKPVDSGKAADAGSPAEGSGEVAPNANAGDESEQASLNV